MSRPRTPASCICTGSALGVALSIAWTLSAFASPHPAPPKSKTDEPVLQADPAGPDAVAQRVNQLMHLTRSQVVTLDLPAGPPQPFETIEVDISIEGKPYTMLLDWHSIRAPGYQVLVQQDDGSLVNAVPGPVRTMRGRMADAFGSEIAASLLEDGLYAKVVLPDGSRYWVQPVPEAAEPDHAGQHLIYQCEDVLHGPEKCGVPPLANEVEQMQPDDGGGIAGEGVPPYCTALMACDTDHEYYLNWGSSVANVEARINNVMNAVNTQYENELNITHAIGTIVVRASADDPYTSTNNSEFLCQYNTEWRTNMLHIPRDVGQMFAGRQIDGDVIGTASDIGDICNYDGCCDCGMFGLSGSYCFVESDYSGVGTTPFGCTTDLSAHELGHLWGAHHCGCVAPEYTMNPFIVCANVHNPVASIIPIAQYRDTRPCLEPCRGGNANNDCADATPIFDGATAFDTLGATTDGHQHPGSGVLGNGPGECPYDGQTYNDVWFIYTATCSTDVAVSLCGSGYDTDIVIYDSIECIPGDDDVVACNDDGCTTTDPFIYNQQSILLAVPMIKDQQYMIRIGGWQAPDNGAGTITITPNETLDSDGDGDLNCDDNCPFVANAGQEDCDADGVGDACSTAGDCNENGTPDNCDITSGTSQDANGNGIPDECEPPDCPEDLDGNGTVNVVDLLAVIAAWGDTEGPPDVNGDGIVNVGDLLDVIRAWGPC